ncbi:hypothetical protein G9C98_001709 [Cotesia typhae]|uniref:Uncharacterized protein n=1 Tax=Cotesia typhae TaxID=2053667 RepID=A0A8J5R1W8_9HYME|nr:hypothetical protein G9C98_001709 [Cotesia typhae]
MSQSRKSNDGPSEKNAQNTGGYSNMIPSSSSNMIPTSSSNMIPISSSIMVPIRPGDMIPIRPCSQSLQQTLEVWDILLSQLANCPTQNWEDMMIKKQELDCHRMTTALFSVLCEYKGRRSTPLRSIPEPPPNPQLLRLDHMLKAEGITDGRVRATLKIGTDTIENAEYRAKLGQIRQYYYEQIDKYNQSLNDFTMHVVTLLRQHSNVRPITANEVENMGRIIRKKFLDVQIELKQIICEAIMTLKSRFLDARRKRRNFSQRAADVLNEYFYANLNNPYPSEEDKEALSRRCGLTLIQVSNWFGNKRIRYKKTVGKAQEEANAVKKAATMPNTVPQSTSTSAVSSAPSTSSQNSTGHVVRDYSSNYGSQLYNDPLMSYIMMDQSNKGLVPEPKSFPREIVPEFSVLRNSSDSDSDSQENEKRPRL